MQKLIAVIDAMNFSEEQFMRFQEIAKKINGKLTFIFLEDVVGEMLPFAGGMPQDVFPYYAELNWKNIDDRRKKIEEKVELFYKICRDKNIHATLLEKEGMQLDDVMKESRFADLLLINNDITFNEIIDSNPPKFVKDVLREAQCPVLVVPPIIFDIDEIVFSYNGSYSSMFAIKEFTKLFQNIADKKVTVLFVDEKESFEVKDKAMLEDYLSLHYGNYEIKLLSGDPAFEITAYLIKNPKTLVTLGAYGRGKLSQFFEQSNAEKMLKTVNRYTFITHP